MEEKNLNVMQCLEKCDGSTFFDFWVPYIDIVRLLICAGFHLTGSPLVPLILPNEYANQILFNQVK